MARIDFHAIKEAAKAVLEADEDLADVTVEVERARPFGADSAPWIGIFLEEAEFEEEEQPISANTTARARLPLVLLVIGHALGEPAEARKQRDDIMGIAQLALMRNPSLNGTVDHGMIIDMEFRSARPESGETDDWFGIGTITLECVATAIT